MILNLIAIVSGLVGALIISVALFLFPSTTKSYRYIVFLLLAVGAIILGCSIRWLTQMTS